MNKKIVFPKQYGLKRLFPLFLLAALLFSGCPQVHQNATFEETPPGIPQNVRVRPGNNRLIVTWDEVPRATSYEVVWGEEGRNELSQRQGANTTVLVLDGLENYKTYWVKVLARNSAGSSAFSFPVMEIPAVQIPGPSVVMHRGGELSIGWAAEPGVVYEIWFNTSDNIDNATRWATITGTGIVAGSTITGLFDGTTYYVWIRLQDGRTSIGIPGIPRAPLSPDHPDFVFVPGGTVVGSIRYAMQYDIPLGYMNAGTARNKQGVFVEDRIVTIEPFFMAKHEVTIGLWHRVKEWAIGAGYTFRPAPPQRPALIEGPTGNGNIPITFVCWRDAIVWSNAYSEMTPGLQPVYYTSRNGSVLRDANNPNVDNAYMNRSRNGFRLPTEVEREFAARGGDPGQADWMFFFAGSDTAKDVAWYHGNSPNQLRTVGTKAPNRLGIHDLSGNAMEWGWGWMNWAVPATAATPVDGEARGGRFTQKPMMGGTVFANITMSVVADRWSFGTTHRDDRVGFRVVRRAQ